MSKRRFLIVTDTTTKLGIAIPIDKKGKLNYA